MEKSFDFGALLRNNEKKHKSKPTQFVSVASGIQKRLETNIKNRKSSRLTTFDKIRDLPACDTPDKVSEAQLKIERRRQQLEKWKAEKEKKKKEEAAQKKKPFVAGVARAPLKFVPPPPPPKPSTSGRVTRSQSVKNTIKTKTSPKQSRLAQSFAPKNASFRPPEIKNLIKLPTLIPLSKTRSKKNSHTLTFDPVLPNTLANSSKQTRSRTVINRQTATEIKKTNVKTKVDDKSIGKLPKKPTPKASRITKKPLQSSSSGSDIDANHILKRIKSPVRKPFIKQTKVSKPLTPKILQLESASDKSSSEMGSLEEKSSKRRSIRISIKAVNVNESSTDKLSSDSKSSIEDQPTIIKKSTRKSVPTNFRPLIMSSSSSEKLTDVESDKTVKRNSLRKSLPNTPKNKIIPKSESSSEEKLRPSKSPIDLPLTPEQIELAKRISPCVTLSRGKDNARKEMKWKRDEGMLDDDASDMDSVEHFRQQLTSEIKRMTEMCETWDRISQQTTLPESIQEAVLSAVGQARLLMSQKLQQFSSLVERCARPEPGSALVTSADLRGFWDMVFMQVVNVDMRFKKLDEMRARGWTEDKPEEKKVLVKAKRVVAKTVKPGGPSRLREMIAAARKAKKEQEVQPQTPEKTFEAGFFCVRSPVRSTASSSPATPLNKPNLLKSVLSSEAKKASASKNCASFAMLRASILGKYVESDGVAPLPITPQMTPINLYATPGRSILKSANISTQKSGKKSIKLVLFDDSDQDVSFVSIVSDRDRVPAEKEPKVIIEPINIEKDETAMDIEKNTKGKENAKKPNLIRQDAVEDISPVMTRSRRKSANTPNVNTDNKEVIKEDKTPKRSRKKKEEVKTPRQSRKKKTEAKSTEVESKPKRSAKNALQEVEVNIIEEIIPTPKRSSRRRKTAVLQDVMT